MKFAKFMATATGRLIRMGLGLAMMGIGLGWVGGVAGGVIAIVGLAPIIAGLFNVCLIAPLVHAPFRGEDLPGGRTPPPARPATPAGSH